MNGLDVAEDDPDFRFYFAKPVSYPRGWVGDMEPIAGVVLGTGTAEAQVLQFDVEKEAPGPTPKPEPEPAPKPGPQPSPARCPSPGRVSEVPRCCPPCSSWAGLLCSEGGARVTRMETSRSDL